MFWKQYVLESRWFFDHHNTEFCTFTFNSEGNFANLFKLGGAGSSHSVLMRTIQQVCGIQNGNWMAADNCKPVAIYQVIGPNRPFSETGLPVMQDEPNGSKTLVFNLELVGRFDEKGLPVINPQEAPLGLHLT